MGKIVDFNQLSTIRSSHKDKKIVHCHGVFDLFHFGHLTHLKSARKLGETLVLTVTPDQFVNKGPGRPRYSEMQRALILSSLEFVDYVVINKHPKAIQAILALKPNVYVKGPDYRDKQSDLTGGIFEEEDAVHSIGGTIEFTQDETESSTTLINQYFNQWTDEQKLAIEKIHQTTSLPALLKIINAFSDLRVLVVGEPIVDSYVFCQAENISSKSPTVSARFLYQEDYAGGSLAIANHLAALGCKVTLLFSHGNEPYFKNLLSSTINSTVSIVDFPIQDIPTPRKTRFVTPFRTQRIFELIDLRSDQWQHHDPTAFSEKYLDLSKSNDLAIIADFGHGLFESKVLETVTNSRIFKAVNTQTNSGNLGFNPFTKHTRYDYLSIDERECRLAVHDRFSAPIEVARRSVIEHIKTRTSVTLGTNGSLYFTPDGSYSSCPTFFKEVVDTTGAGDAYFAITSLLAKLDVDSPIIPFVGNCFAGLKSRILGNKSAVLKNDLVRTLQAILS